MPLLALSEKTANHLDPLFFLFRAYSSALPSFLRNLWALLVTALHASTTRATKAPSSLYPNPTKATPGTFLANLHSLLFYHAWSSVAHGVDQFSAAIKGPLFADCSGTVLEIGAGTGNNIKYYRREHVNLLVLVEPNAFMHAALREQAQTAGFAESDGSLLILGCGGGVKDEPTLVSVLGGSEGVVDAVVCVHVLCGVPGLPETIDMYRRLLRSGGRLMFYEHVQSKDKPTVWWQEMYMRYGWTWLMGGCRLTQRTGEIIKGESGRWTELDMQSTDCSKWSCVPAVYGHAIKA